MNQTQRKYLIDKINKQVSITVKTLESSNPEYPSLSNYLLHEVMSGRIDIIDHDKIKEVIRQKALTAQQGRSNWMGDSSIFGTDTQLAFKPEEFFIVPEAYRELRDEVRSKREQIKEQITMLRIQEESLVTRITLASDKSLQQVINEVDDMGNLSLMETKLKLLN